MSSGDADPNALSMAKRVEYYRRLGIEPGGKRRPVNPRRSEAPPVLETTTDKANVNEEEEEEFALHQLPIYAQDDFRVNYLRKLSYRGVWVPSAHRPPQHQTVTIFDWDDTLLCTTYLNMCSADDAAQMRSNSIYCTSMRKNCWS
eukprot:Platyproteum_vivax@DN5351_c0_g1_i2.p1